MMKNLGVQGEIICETHDYEGWVRIDLRVGTMCAANIMVQVDGTKDIDAAIDSACRALSVELKKEYRR